MCGRESDRQNESAIGSQATSVRLALYSYVHRRLRPYIGYVLDTVAILGRVIIFKPLISLASHPHLEAELLGGGYRPTSMMLMLGVPGSNQAPATNTARRTPRSG
jgi:hypothetical protein